MGVGDGEEALRMVDTMVPDLLCLTCYCLNSGSGGCLTLIINSAPPQSESSC